MTFMLDLLTFSNRCLSTFVTQDYISNGGIRLSADLETFANSIQNYIIPMGLDLA